MVDITAKKAKGKGKGYEKWATLHNLKQMAVTISIYEESGFSSPEELEAALTAASAELSNVHAELKAVESTLREKKDLQKQLLAYIKTKPARDGLKAQKTEKARKNYREQRKIEFIIAEAATRFLTAGRSHDVSEKAEGGHSLSPGIWPGDLRGEVEIPGNLCPGGQGYLAVQRAAGGDVQHHRRGAGRHPKGADR